MVKSLVMLLFFVAAHLAVTLGAPLFFSSAGLITLFWPASGIALAAVLAGGVSLRMGDPVLVHAGSHIGT